MVQLLSMVYLIANDGCIAVTGTIKMKSTEVQNPRRIPHISVRAYTTTHARKLAHAPFSFASACIWACGYLVYRARPSSFALAMHAREKGLAKVTID